MANILEYFVLHSLLNTKIFLLKLIKNFEEQVEDFLTSQVRV